MITIQRGVNARTRPLGDEYLSVFVMKKRQMLVSAFILAAVSTATGTAWFGEMASVQERSELAFRGSFISVAYHLLYGTVYGNPEGSGLLGIYEHLDALILMNPPLDYYVIHNIMGYFILILEPLYVTAILATGLYMMFFSMSPSGRGKAKALLPRLLASMVAVTLSMDMLRLAFRVSHAFCRDLMDKSGVPVHALFTETLNDLVRSFSASAAASFDGGYVFLMLVFGAAIGTATLLAVRYVMLVVFALVFPLGIFLYTFNISRNVGRFMIEQTVLWTFVQAVVTILLVVVNLGMSLMGVSGDLKTLAGITAFIAVFLSPVILLTMIKRFLP